MIAALDAAYDGGAGFGACALFETWDAALPCALHKVRLDAVAAYEPGAFYRRELPVLAAALKAAQAKPAAVLIDGYVWLGRYRRGLGAHLFEAIDGASPVIGLAKTKFSDDDWSLRVLRGRSVRPLYVTAAGMTVEEAAGRVAAMAGAGRIPLMMNCADRAAREASAAAR